MAKPGEYLYYLSYFWPYLSVPAEQKPKSSLIACTVCGFSRCPGCPWEDYCRHCKQTIAYPINIIDHFDRCENYKEFIKSLEMTKH